MTVTSTLAVEVRLLVSIGLIWAGFVVCVCVQDYYPPDETPDDHVESMRDAYNRHSKGTAALEVSAIIVLGTNLVSKMNPHEAAVMRKLQTETLVVTPEITRALATRCPQIRVPHIPTRQF